jgi:CRISPR/Cas system-associated exonuclease Cas4 (RecB family)
MRCLRKQWFRLRGVETDIVESPDLGLDFRAKVGTDRHVAIQTRLKKALGKDWLSVREYLTESGIDLDCEITENGLESLVTVNDPPIKFAVDGIIRIDGRIFLLEIKTCDYSSFEHLTQQKSVHEDQVTLYSAILGIRDVLFLYEDRQNGSMKSYQYTVKESSVEEAKSKMQLVMDMSEKGIAPNRLPKSDYMCSNCEYAKKCSEW